ncbi:mevalonate kinase [bacterium]|nr:mevalonate kinase [bacterium]
MISAPAKIILFGEHAAVYHQPAIAVPVNNLRAYASVHPASSEVGLKLVTTEDGQSLPIQIDPADVNSAFATTVRLVLAHCRAEMPKAEIRIDSDIPVASGLGSGAAVTTVLAKAVAEALGHPLSNEALNEIVFEVEKIYHGTPSGIDNTVIVYERPIYFIKGRPFELLSIAAPLTLLIADTGVAASTKIAVGDVRRLYEAQPEKMQTLFSSIGAITNRASARP